jgi:hypothetical protein
VTSGAPERFQLAVARVHLKLIGGAILLPAGVAVVLLKGKPS